MLYAVFVRFVVKGKVGKDPLKGYNRWDGVFFLVVGDLLEAFKVDEPVRPLDPGHEQRQTPHHKHSAGLVIAQANVQVILVPIDGLWELAEHRRLVTHHKVIPKLGPVLPVVLD